MRNEKYALLDSLWLALRKEIERQYLPRSRRFVVPSGVELRREKKGRGAGWIRFAELCIAVLQQPTVAVDDFVVKVVIGFFENTEWIGCYQPSKRTRCNIWRVKGAHSIIRGSALCA